MTKYRSVGKELRQALPYKSKLITQQWVLLVFRTEFSSLTFLISPRPRGGEGSGERGNSIG